MGFARSLLLKASRSQWLARQLRERRFFQRAVKRFMPGESLNDALEAASQFAKAGMGTVLTELGEQVTNRAEAAAVRDHYLGVFEKIQRRKLPAHVSIKLTHLGLDASKEGCIQDVLKLAARAEQARAFLWIDMEESRYVDATLDVYRRAEAQRKLVSLGAKVRILISYGSAWFAWYMRRLAERPANVWFVLRNVV